MRVAVGMVGVGHCACGKSGCLGIVLSWAFEGSFRASSSSGSGGAGKSFGVLLSRYGR